MANKALGTFRVFMLFCLLFSASNLTRTCNYTFIFPSLNGSTIFTAVEKTEISIPFALNTSCDEEDKLRVKVAKLEEPDGFLMIQCQFVQYTNGTCSTAYSSCQCLTGEGNYSYKLNKNVTLLDNATWIWYIDDEHPLGSKLVFNILSEDNLAEGIGIQKDSKFLALAVAGSLAIVVSVVVIVLVRAKQAKRKSTPVHFETTAVVRQGSSGSLCQRQACETVSLNSYYCTVADRQTSAARPAHRLPAPEIFEETYDNGLELDQKNPKKKAEAAMANGSADYSNCWECSDEVYENEFAEHE